MCGIPRSGSTLIWQILQEVFEGRREVIKTHPDIWESNEDTIIASIRDPRDVVLSLLKVRLSRQETETVTQDDIEIVLARTVLSFNKLSELLNQNSNVVLRYEHFYNDYSIIYNMITSTFDIIFSSDSCKRISDKFSVENNKKRASQLKNFNEVGTYQIHGDHIDYVDPGCWIKYLPDWSLGRVKEICKPLCKEWDYEN
jgi:hypothetical protein